MNKIKNCIACRLHIVAFGSFVSFLAHKRGGKIEFSEYRHVLSIQSVNPLSFFGTIVSSVKPLSTPLRGKYILAQTHHKELVRAHNFYRAYKKGRSHERKPPLFSSLPTPYMQSSPDYFRLSPATINNNFTRLMTR